MYGTENRVVLPEGLARVDEHVGAVLYLALVAGAGTVDRGHEYRPSHGGDGVPRVVVVLVRLAWLRCFAGQAPAAAQMPSFFVRAWDGPLLVAAPAVLAHHEDLDRRLLFQ